MNYLKIYCNLIRKAENRILNQVYREKHHIFPISIYGKNKRIVYLTGREHYIAHVLLEKICIKRYGLNSWKTQKMIKAHISMKADKSGFRYYNSHLYESARIRFSNIMRNNNPMKDIEISKKISGENHYLYNINGEKHPLYNIKRPNEVKNKISESKCKFLYKITDPNGKIYEIKNLNKFCRDNYLHPGAMCDVSNKKIKHHKNWMVEKIGLCGIID